MSTHTAEAIELIHNRPGFAREVARQIGFTRANDFKSAPVMIGMGMTERQAQLLGFIRSRVEADGVAPSFDEMLAFTGLRSKSGIHRLLTALEERGHIFRIPNRARCIALREA